MKQSASAPRARYQMLRRTEFLRAGRQLRPVHMQAHQDGRGSRRDAWGRLCLSGCDTGTGANAVSRGSTEPADRRPVRFRAAVPDRSGGVRAWLRNSLRCFTAADDRRKKRISSVFARSELNTEHLLAHCSHPAGDGTRQQRLRLCQATFPFASDALSDGR